jgi:hypothetical protein
VEGGEDVNGVEFTEKVLVVETIGGRAKDEVGHLFRRGAGEILEQWFEEGGDGKTEEVLDEGGFVGSIVIFIGIIRGGRANVHVIDEKVAINNGHTVHDHRVDGDLGLGAVVNFNDKLGAVEDNKHEYRGEVGEDVNREEIGDGMAGGAGGLVRGDEVGRVVRGGDSFELNFELAGGDVLGAGGGVETGGHIVGVGLCRKGGKGKACSVAKVAGER